MTRDWIFLYGPPAPVQRAPSAGYVIGPHAEAMVARIAILHGLTVEALKSPDRKKPVAHARQQAMYELYRTGRYSLPTIGAYFGGRDHTTVLHGVRAHEARLRDEAERVAA